MRRWKVVRGRVEGKQSRLQRLIAGVRTRIACSAAVEKNPLCGIVRLDGAGPGAPDSLGDSDEACREIYLTTLAPGGISAWHLHHVHEDHLFVAAGRVRIVLYDAREGSRTAGVLNQFCVGGQDRQVIVVPPGVYHGLRNEGDTEALIVSLPMAPSGAPLRGHCRMVKQAPEIPFDWQSEDER